MRLLMYNTTGTFSLTKDLIGDDEVPPYAILSHTWQQDQEVTFNDLINETGENKAGYNKIRFCGEQAKRDGLRYFWVDTCCINKADHTELQDAINSMFYWYQNAVKCYVFLSDVSVAKRKANSERSEFSWMPALRESRWFTRGWTLQELLAPRAVEFFSREGKLLGDKRSLEKHIHEITGIDVSALRDTPLQDFDTEKRFSWARNRQTMRKEDKAYSLLGIFGIFMLPNYGEGEENAIKRLRKEIRKSRGDKLLSLNEEQKRMLLDSLRFDQIDARQISIKNAHAKTCKWLLHKSEYLDWLDMSKLGQHYGFLWIKGKPGTGKSTLMKFALAHARKTMKDRIAISFFFNARGEDVEKSTIGTYRSLLLQLLERLPALQGVFDLLGLSTSISTDYQWSVESLKMLLEQAIQNLRGSAVVCFIDALDECEECQIRDMVQFFGCLSEFAVSNSICFQVCFSSRHYPHITIKKGLDLVLEGQEGHTQDIVNYLKTELEIGQSKIAQQVRNDLQEKASGVFMWVVLVVDILNKEHDRGRMHALRRRLQEIPSDLHKLFRDILTRDSRNKEELLLCIQWVLFAKQPLSPQQLYFAVISSVEPEAVLLWDSDEIGLDVIKRFILDSSKGLTEITPKLQKVQFIHESVRDFLLKEDGFGNIWPELRHNFQGQSHEQLKQCCLTYMSIPVFTLLKIPERLSEVTSQQIAGFCKSAREAFPFLEYAVQNVLHHANAAEGCGVNQADFLKTFKFPRWVELDNLFEKFGVRRHTQETSLLYILGERNMPNLIKGHMSVLSCLKVEKERYGAPFFAAVAAGSKEAVQVFVEGLAADQLTETQPLEPYKLQFKHKNPTGTFGRDFKFSKGRGVLSYSAEFGNEVVFAFLYKTGAFEINSKDNNGRTPLWWAAQNGHEAVVKLLLDTGKVEINAKDDNGQTPLWWAAQNGHEAVVKLLLDTGKVEIDAKDDNGQTPLLRAAQNRHEAVVKLLLDTGKVEINVKDSDGWTPLWWAARNGHEAVVKLLLDTGKVEIDAKDNNGQTPLWWAAWNGHEAVVKLLLDTGKVEIDVKDSDGWTLLWWAARNGHEAVVKLLLDTGKVEIDVKDNNRQTPL